MLGAMLWKTRRQARLRRVRRRRARRRIVSRCLSALAALGLAASGAAQTGVWSQESGPQGTAALGTARASFAYDIVRARTVMFAFFGGPVGSGQPATAETWEYDGATWLHCDTMPAFSNTTASDLAYDELRGRTVVVTATTQTLTTSEWDGSHWSVRDTRPLASSLLPPPHIELAYDLVHAECVCAVQTFGSAQPPTQTWNGASWSVRASVPPFVGSMAFDALRGQVVMAGTSALVAWDGSTWSQVTVVPPLSASLQLTSDPWGARVLVVGTDGSLWQWRGAGFQSLPAIGTPAPGNTRAVTYDLARSRLLRLTDGPPVASAVTAFRDLPATAATFAPLGSGCAGPLGVPALAAVAGSPPRIGQSFQLRLTRIPDGPANRVFGVLGTTATAWNGAPLPLALGPLGAPGCSLFVAPEVDVPLVPALQAANWLVPIPAAVAVIGVHLFVQGAVLVPGFNAAGVVVTNAGDARIGTQ
jgi:hypothetical protein